MVDIDKILEKRKTSGARNWWNPDEQGETLEGYVKRRYEGNYGKTRFDIENSNGEIITTPGHTILVRILENENLKPGDYVKIWYEGLTKTGSGQAANQYSVSVIHEEEFDEFGIEPYEGTVTGEKAAEKEAEVPEEFDQETEAAQIPEEQGVAESTEGESEGEITSEAVEFVEHLMDSHNTMDIEDLDKYLNSVRDYGVDAEEAAIVAGFEVEDGVVK